MSRPSSGGRALTAALLAALALAAGTAGAAAETGSVTFELQWTIAAERIAPIAGSGATLFRAAVTLHPDGRVSGGVRRDRSAGPRAAARSDVKVGEGRLGARWKVLDPSTIQGVSDFPTFVTVTTIRASGESCSATIENRLKPGQSVYVKPSLLQRGETETFSRFDVGQVSCTAVR